MADLQRVELKVADSGLKHAIDQWFEAIVQVSGIRNPHKLALLGSITSYEIVPDAPMFNQFIFRSWVDRSIVNSPADPGSPSFFARHSNVFGELLTRATADVDAEVPAETQARIDVKMQNITAVQEKIEAERKRVREAWEVEAKARGFTDPLSNDYIIARIGFHSSELAYTKLRQWRAEIARYNTQIDKLRASTMSAADRNLIRLHEFGTLQEYQVKRPKTADLERKYSLDEVKLADFDTYAIPSAFEDGQDILPAIDLEEFLKRKGQRSVKITRASSSTITHESSWSGSAGGSFGFISWEVRASGKETFTRTVKRLGELDISFENIGEIFAIRGPWFALSGLTHPESQEALKEDPKGLAAPLANLIHSVIVVRGLSLTLHFDNSDDWDRFTENSGGGSGSFFGIPIGPKGGGGGTMSESSRDRATSTITFSDSADQCRVVGFRVEPVLTFGTTQPLQILQPWRLAHVEQLAPLSVEATDLALS